MEGPKIKFIERTFGELERGIIPNVKDPYKIMSSLGPKMIEAVLHNPSGYSNNEVCQILALDGDVVVGATNAFSGRFCKDGEIAITQSGSYLYSHEDYRKENIGAELFYRLSKLHPSGNNLFAGISQMALPLYRALRYSVFEFPRLIYLRRSRSVIEAFLHSERWWISPFIWVADSCLWLHRSFLRLFSSFRLRNYKVEQVLEVPREVEDMVLADNHRYKELHDKAWFQWSLQYTISEDIRTKRRLYVVKNQRNIEAFFLIKQEFFEQASRRGFRNVYLGSVVEWGIASNSNLKENDIAMLSLNSFDKNIDGIQFASADSRTIKKLRRRLFVHVGNANMAVRMGGEKESLWRDINNWRIRIAASDTVLN